MLFLEIFEVCFGILHLYHDNVVDHTEIVVSL
jgi:hypothetical protein